MTETEIEDAIDATKQTISLYEFILEELENAENDKDLADVYRLIRNANQGDDERELSHWIEIRLKDYFRNRGMWDEEERYIDYDKINNG